MALKLTKIYLGSWNKHIESVVKKVTSGIGAMRRIRDFVDRETLSSIYNALVGLRPHFDYCSYVWDTKATNALGWESLKTRRAKSKANQMYKVLNDLAPSSLATVFVGKRNITKYDLMGSSTSPQLLYLCHKLKTLRKASVMMKLNCAGNSFPADMRDSDTLIMIYQHS